MNNHDFLNYYPIRICEHEEKNGVITVLFTDRKKSLADRIFFKKLKQKPSKIDLDEMGSFFWPHFDGNNNVAQIINIGKEKFGNNIEPAEERIIKFITQMAETKLIRLYEKKN